MRRSRSPAARCRRSQAIVDAIGVSILVLAHPDTAICLQPLQLMLVLSACLALSISQDTHGSWSIPLPCRRLAPQPLPRRQ
ncbi:hypothetical protein AAHA92_29009 [Salvia divinorum]|uniref:Uncharacterized protein n=1 Tax=Salvia divinorum TaxID=28513 RepID=A0ABD1FWW7_SALDI